MCNWFLLIFGVYSALSPIEDISTSTEAIEYFRKQFSRADSTLSMKCCLRL